MSSLGQTKIRAVISFSTPLAASFTTFATLVTSCALSQLIMTPSASRAPNFSIPSRSAAIKIVGFCAGLMLRRNPSTLNVSYSLVIFSPENASCMNRTTSRTFLYGSTNGTPFQRSTITLLDEPIPIAKRPGAASASAATLCAITGAVRVYAGTIAVPSRRRGSQAAASANGVNASAPSVSADQMSLYPQSANCAYFSLWSCK